MSAREGLAPAEPHARCMRAACLGAPRSRAHYALRPSAVGMSIVQLHDTRIGFAAFESQRESRRTDPSSAASGRAVKPVERGPSSTRLQCRVLYGPSWRYARTRSYCCVPPSAPPLMDPPSESPSHDALLVAAVAAPAAAAGAHGVAAAVTLVVPAHAHALALALARVLLRPLARGYILVPLRDEHVVEIRCLAVVQLDDHRVAARVTRRSRCRRAACGQGRGDVVVIIVRAHCCGAASVSATRTGGSDAVVVVLAAPPARPRRSPPHPRRRWRRSRARASLRSTSRGSPQRDPAECATRWGCCV